jgi:hypothetical protein
MGSLCLFAAALSLAFQVSAIPNPHPALTARALPSSASSPPAAAVTNFNASIPTSILAALSSAGAANLVDYSVPPAVLASESQQYAAWTSAFYKTASPSELAAIAAYNSQADAALASWTSAAYAPLSPSDSALLAAEYASWTAAFGPTASAKVAAPAAAPTMPPMAKTDSATTNGITCLRQQGLPKPWTVNPTDCAAAVANTCRELQESKTGQSYWDAWVWSYASSCAVGYWFPKSLVNATTAPDGTDVVPSAAECANQVFGQMERLCVAEGDWMRNAASVNLAQLPDVKRDFSGRQVDAGRVSYLFAPRPWPCVSHCAAKQV